MTATELNGDKPKRRDKLVIMTEILIIAMRGASKTQIMYKANLSFSQLKHYLALLLRKSLLEKSPLNKREIYKATPKGLEFMERQLQIIDLINEDHIETA
ncbi:MAG TPA: winged helix-turn-helix domain-containing protein [Candidatus Limnocylindrales bacterium]|nr:winged helix-turn-helix domain-containing protein [Candidatus Limnocylindrales bacterium]